jgi:hypothetical protein
MGFSFLIWRPAFLETLEEKKESRKPGPVNLPPSRWPLIPPEYSSGNPLLPSKRTLFNTVIAANIALSPFFVKLFFAFLKSF